MADSITQFFREINSGFLVRDWSQAFDIFYKVDRGEAEPQFLKFAAYSPENHDKLKKMMETEDSQKFYIHETDLIRYYNEFLIKGLKTRLENENPPSIELLENAYGIAAQILQEYFENIGSSRILRSLNEVINAIETCLVQGNFEFSDVIQMINKKDHLHFHCANVGLSCMTLGVKFQMKPEAVRELGLGGMLFDIGKKAVPGGILFKSDPLAPEENKEIRKHPSAGKKVLNDMKCYNQNILDMAAEHHEKYNGEGYPFGLKGEKISLYARVCSILDVFNALISERSYHQPRTPFEALQVMKNEMPGHFDNRILVNFIKTLATSPQPVANSSP